MMQVNRLHTSPNQWPRTRRVHDLSILTSMPAGKCVPLGFIPMFREDDLTARLSVAVEMMETAELLMNPVQLRVTAYLVPFLAFEKFEGSRDQFDRAYMSQPKVEGGSVVPFIDSHVMGAHGSKHIYMYAGLHAGTADDVNTGYAQAYNLVINYRRKMRSKELTHRTALETTLAEAFWPSSRFQHVVPDFDQAVIDGEVALNIVNSQMPVSGIGWGAAQTDTAGPATVKDPTTTAAGEAYARYFSSTAALAVRSKGGTGAAAIPDIYAEMAANGITVSLSSLDQARKTQAFAKLRAKFEGHDDEWIIDMLMDGLSIPDQALKQPILLADRTVSFAQAKRYATDAGNLSESAVSGAAVENLSIRVPRLATGGIVVIMAEAVPVQLFERQRDPFFHSTDHRLWPEYVRDEMDTEKVEALLNAEIDTSHSAPGGTFGFVPLNWKWTSWGPRVGGKFYRPVSNTTADVERRRLWSVEAIDPVLAEDFYIVSEMHLKPFLDEESDPFEATVQGAAMIGGHTVFGGMLLEATNNYDAVQAKAPTTQIEKD
jgi:hypothetical protein